MTHIVGKIKEIADQNNPKRNLGNIKIGKTANFSVKPKRIVEDKTVNRNNIVWLHHLFYLDRGPTSNLTWEDFKSPLPIKEGRLVSDNGNFKKIFVRQQSGINARFTCRVNVLAPTVVDFSMSLNRGTSIAVYKALEDSDTKITPIKVFSTEGGVISGVQKMAVDLNAPGTWVISILYYVQHGADKTFAGGPLQEKSSIEILGDLGSQVHSFEIPDKLPDTKLTFDTTQGTNGIESILVDGAKGPVLQNRIYFNRLDQSSETNGGFTVFGYGLFEEQELSTGLTVKSSTGIEFNVTGNKKLELPVGSTIIVGTDTHTIRDSSYDSELDETIFEVAEPAFLGANNEAINIKRLIHIVDINQSATEAECLVLSHNNVKAGQTYIYRIDYFNAEGQRSIKSDTISIEAGDLTPPSILSGLSATGMFKSIKINWTQPTDVDIKGMNVWETANPVIGTDEPVATIQKTDVIPDSIIVTRNSSGELLDDTSYTFYVSVFDWAGNETLLSLPSATATTTVSIKTNATGQRIELDTASRKLKYFDSNDTQIITIGEDILGTDDGIGVTGGVIYSNNTDPTRDNISVVNTYSSAHTGSQDGIFSQLFTDVGVIGSPAQQLSAIKGEINNGINSLYEVVAIHGIYGGPVTPQSFAGKFVGAPVACLNDMVVSGTYGINTVGFTMPPGAINGYVLTCDADGVGSWAPAVSGSGSAATFIQDSDSDTKVQVEESGDEDLIRFDTAGVERAIISGDKIIMGSSTSTLTEDGFIGINRSFISSIADEVNTEYIEITQAATQAEITVNRLGAGTYRDLVFSTGGSEVMRLTSGGSLGIGTSNPVSLLNVSGTANVMGFKMWPGSQDGYILTSDAVGLASWEDPASLSLNQIQDTDGNTKVLINTTDNISFIIAGTEEARFKSNQLVFGGTASDAANGISLINKEISIVSASSNASSLELSLQGGTQTNIKSDRTGVAGVYLPLSISVNNTEQVRFETDDSTIFGASSTDFTAGNIVSVAKDIVYATAASNAETLILSANAGSYTSIESGKTGSATARPLTFRTNSAERMRIRTDGEVQIGTTGTPVSVGNGIGLFLGDNGSDFTDPGTDSAGIYAKSVAGNTELFAIDEAGNTTQLSPHDPETGEWIFWSRNTKTGEVKRINIERLVRAMEELTGKEFIEEWIEDDRGKRKGKKKKKKKDSQVKALGRFRY